MLRFEGAMQARLLGSGILAVEFAGGPDRWADIVATNGPLGMSAVRESLRWDAAVFDLVEDGCLWASLERPSALLLATAAVCATVKFVLLGAGLGYAVRSWRRGAGRGHRLS